MFSKPSFVFAAFAVAAQLASAQTPPACLLAVVNTNSNPADVQGICNKANEMGTRLTDMCNPQSNLEAAQQAFIRVCGNAGVSVEMKALAPSSTGKDANPSSTTTSHTTTSRTTASSTPVPPTSVESCLSCTTTTSADATNPPASNAPAETGLITVPGGTGNDTQATETGTGSGSGSASRSSTSSATVSAGAGTTTTSTPTGAASHIQVAGLSFGAIAVAGLAMAL